VRSGVAQPESIADHMYRMAVLALTMAGSARYDQPRLIKLAIVHDIAEAIVGDIAPADNVSKEDKHAREARALEDIVAMLGPGTAAADEVSALWCGTRRRAFDSGTDGVAALE
jgi:putative hydrolases of HD superfamily